MPILYKHKLHLHTGENDVFSAKPIEIKALRVAMQITQRELAAVMGVYHVGPVSKPVSDWERGIHRPRLVYRSKMLQMVEAFRPQYLEALAKLKEKQRETSRLPNARVVRYPAGTKRAERDTESVGKNLAAPHRELPADPR